MPYIGRAATNAGSVNYLDDISSGFDGSDTTFTCAIKGTTITPGQENVYIYLDGVFQHPSDAYSISGSTITFTEAPVNGTDFTAYVAGEGAYLDDGTVSTAKLNDDAVTASKLDDDGTGFQVGDLGVGGSLTSGDKLTVTGRLRASGGIIGDLTGNVTGNASGTALTVTQAAQTAITSVGTLTGLTSSGTIVLGDLDIIPTSSNVSVIKHDSGSGSLTIQGDQVNIKNRAGDETGLAYNDGGGVALSHNSKVTSSSADTTFKIETTTGTSIFPILDFVSSHNSVGGKIRQDGTDVISFDNSFNSTFAGNVSLKGDSGTLNFLNASGTLRAFLQLSSTGLIIDTDSFLEFKPNNTRALYIDSSLNSTFAGDVTVDGDRYMLTESGTNKGFFGKDDWATSGGSADNINVGSYSGEVKLTAGGATSSTSNIVCHTDKSTSFANGTRTQGGAIEQYAISGGGRSVRIIRQETGTYTGDLTIECSATSWKSVIYKVTIAGHQGSGDWTGMFYWNSGETSHSRSVEDYNGEVGNLSLSSYSGGSGNQGFKLVAPLGSTGLVHPIAIVEIISGGGYVLSNDNITVDFT